MKNDLAAIWLKPKRPMTNFRLGTEILVPSTLRYTNNLTGTNYRQATSEADSAALLKLASPCLSFIGVNRIACRLKGSFRMRQPPDPETDCDARAFRRFKRSGRMGENPVCLRSICHRNLQTPQFLHWFPARDDFRSERCQLHRTKESKPYLER